MRDGRRTVRVVACVTSPELDEALDAYEVGYDAGQLEERRRWEARVQALRELAEQATAGVQDRTPDADGRMDGEPVSLSPDERDTFAEIAFQTRVDELLDGDDGDEDEPRGWIP